MTYTVGSLFAGVEGFGQGLEAAGFQVAWQVEIDKDAVSVLERHYPDTTRLRDVTQVDPSTLAPVDVVTFGSPCQDMSVAGKRAGLAGARSGLFHEAVRIISGLRPAPAFCIWENVPGALSSSDGLDFAAVLDSLADIGALDIAWRVLDAQWFGVPQRRRRIFLVADFAGERAASVLFESESVSGDSQASREAWQGLAVDAEGCADGSGVADIAFTIPATAGRNADGSRIGNGWNTNYVPVGGDGVAPAVTCHAAKGGDPSTDNYVVADTLRSHPRPGSNSVGAVVAAPIAIAENERGEVRGTPYVNALSTGGGKPGQGYGCVMVSAPLTAGGHPNSNAPGRRREDDENLVIAVAVGSAVSASYGNGSPRGDGADNLIAHTLSTRSGATEDGTGRGTPRAASHAGSAVRRLTPVECERLMGWPDDWTRYRADGSEIPDGPRYRMIGNGVVSNVARWIGHRLHSALESQR